jgi:hypothetical protein
VGFCGYLHVELHNRCLIGGIAFEVKVAVFVPALTLNQRCDVIAYIGCLSFLDALDNRSERLGDKVIEWDHGWRFRVSSRRCAPVPVRDLVFSDRRFCKPLHYTFHGNLSFSFEMFIEVIVVPNI